MVKNKEKKEEVLDSDKDGLSDYEEENIYFTDPLNFDTDGDGISDGDEVMMGLNPNGPGRLVDFFVPHGGNDYKPNSLHPKRLVFHVLAAVFIKLLIFVFAAAFPIEAWLTPDVILEQSRKIVSLTNKIREDKGLVILKENSKLNQAAFAKAGDMLLNQYFEHTSPTKIGLSSWLNQLRYDYLSAGENLAMGFNDASEVVNAWTKSKTHYANLIDPDYREIGVGMVSGPFKKEETTLVAQYFGVPSQRELSARQAEKIVAPINIKKTSLVSNISVEPGVVAGNTIKADSANINENTENIDKTPPSVDQNRTKLIVDDSAGKDKLIIKAEVYLSPDTKKSEIYFQDNRLELKRDETDLNKWTGQQIVFLNNQTDNNAPIVLPSLLAEDYYGNAAKTDIRLENVYPNGLSLFDKYLFFKNHRSRTMESLFDISSFYYKALLVFLAISLLLSIFIEIKKQHPHIIFTTLGVMSLLTLLIIF